MIELIKDKYYIHIDRGHKNYTLLKGTSEKMSKKTKYCIVGYYSKIERCIEACIEEISGTRLEKYSGQLKGAVDEVLKAKDKVFEALKQSELNKVSYK